MSAQRLRVERGDPVAPRQQLVEALELREPEGAGQLVEAVVEAQPVVVEPVHVGRATLVALGVQALLGRRVGAHHGPALARRDLLVGVEGEHRGVAATAHGRPVPMRRAERLAGVLHDPEAALGGQALERRQVGGVAEDVHRQQPRRALAHRCGRGRRVDVQRALVDVAEHRAGVLEQHAVGGRDERERRGHDLVAGPDARRPYGEVEAGGAARDGRDREPADPCREGLLEGRQAGPEGEAAGAERLEDAGLLGGADARPRERDHGRVASGITAAWWLRGPAIRFRPASARAGAGRAACPPRASPRAPPSSPR